ncbi:hypothetical protein BW1_005_01970 [Bacillus mycoides NBRC 101238 = DSM 11821]|uniref:Uncharacterized protein n=1 Tax=Bacillus mycoides TaxID=1405 RepID=A0A654AVR8_BACMY|nr:hypothetical protein BW1_005_01970 [Bacillus mycoides NBRC 101238 = DSM 11821]VXC72052.1 hypothetical protein BACI71_70022 [Bacillus mycoides]
MIIYTITNSIGQILLLYVTLKNFNKIVMETCTQEKLPLNYSPEQKSRTD